MKAPPQLPLEIILHIIDSVIDNPARIYSPDDDVTKTLLSCTRVCRATYAHASNRLRQQCMYIDDGKRLADCVAYLKATNHLVPEYDDGKIEDAKGASPGARLRPITSLYLAPFFDKIIHQNTVTYLGELCVLIRSSLTRLVLDVPFCYFARPTSVPDKKLRFSDIRQENLRPFIEALQSLTELIDVVWVNDDFTFTIFSTEDMGDVPYNWDCWPNLRRLALHDQDVGSRLWRSVRKSEQLQSLILVRPWWVHRGCLKTAILRTSPVDSKSSATDTSTLESPKPINIAVVKYSYDPCRTNVREGLFEGASSWPLIDPDNLIKLRLCDLQVPHVPDKSAIADHACTYMTTVALRDEIWSWEGETIS